MNPNSKSTTVVHVAPFSGSGGIAYVSNLISEYKGEQTFKWKEVDSNPSETLRHNTVFRVFGSLKIGAKIVTAVCCSIVNRRNTVVHIHSPSYSGFFEKLFFVLIAGMCGASSVLHLHGGAFKQFYRESRQSTQDIIGRFLTLPDQLVVLSEQWKAFLCEQVNPNLNGRITVLPNAVRLPSRPLQGKQKTHSEDDTFRVVFLGRVSKEKGCGDLLRTSVALRDDINVEFHVMGGGKNLEYYRKKSEDLKLSNIKFHGYTTGIKKINWLRKSDVFMLPSKVENFPISMLEAMAFGLPVVVTDVGVVSEVITERNGIIVSPDDPHGLAEALKYLYYHPERRMEMAINNIQDVKAQYGAPTYMAKLEMLYSGLSS